ncbi:MAG: cation:proton antiporter [Verrucomicrobia bacterium]|nr:cation:proton antiporter [Verrucomicrobiota bacterium]
MGLPICILRARKEFSPHVIKILTWGGLRGGISVALALSLSASPERALILIVTYVVVVFSILVQGLTVPVLLRTVVQPGNGREHSGDHPRLVAPVGGEVADLSRRSPAAEAEGRSEGVALTRTTSK